MYLDNNICRIWNVGRWAIIDKRTNEFIGWMRIKICTALTNNHKNYYDIGFRLIKNISKGIATETAHVSLEYAFSTLNIDEIYAASIENEGSNKISIKLE
ncbi:MAG: GNAT family N-acetyltransferase [Bacteroidetes bacterium]|nr:GNAT family N-acetyltransferase [Bacteroidota bacterium]